MSSPKSTEISLSPSLLYGILPVAVQTRLPHFRSLRHSWSRYTISQSRFISDDGRYDRLEAEVCQLHQDKAKVCQLHQEESSSPQCSRIPSTKSRLPVQTQSSNGIAWKYTNQGIPNCPMPKKTQLTRSVGLSLLEAAISEAEMPEPRSQAFSRQMYIHALVYLIQGLPSDLSNAESIYIDDALSRGFRRHSSTQVSPSSSRTYQQTPSILHRFLASTIIQLFLLCQLVVPYVRYFLYKAYRYERTHQLLEKILESSVNTGEKIAKLWWDILHMISKIPDKNVVATLASFLLWWVQGISGGIQEGIGEGMKIIGATKADFM